MFKSVIFSIWVFDLQKNFETKENCFTHFCCFNSTSRTMSGDLVDKGEIFDGLAPLTRVPISRSISEDVCFFGGDLVCLRWKMLMAVMVLGMYRWPGLNLLIWRLRFWMRKRLGLDF